MHPELRVAVLGCSRIACRSVIPAIRKVSGMRLVAVGNRTLERARETAAEHGVTAHSLEEIIAHPEVDAVYISLPNSLHEEWAICALRAGKHVLVEKPLATSLAGAERIFHVARQQQRVAMEGLMYVFHPAMRKVHGLLADGCIGSIRSVEAAFGFPDMPENDIRYKPALGGGATLDLLIYPLSFSLDVAGGKEPERVTSHLIPHAHHPVDTQGFVQLDWPRFSAQIRYGFGCSYRNEIQVWGTQGRLQMSRAFTPPPDFRQTIELHTNSGKEEIVVEAADHFALMFESFRDRIHCPASRPHHAGKAVLQRMRWMESVLKNAPSPGTSPDLSIVIPVYKSEFVIRATVQEIQAALEKWCTNYEIILVNDCSPDGSERVIQPMVQADSRIRLFTLMRNFGQHNAVMAGLHRARGKTIVMMDDDGQHDPQDIRLLTEAVQQGHDVAYASFEEKVDSRFKNFGSRLNDRMANHLLGKPEDLYLCSFKAITRELRDQILRYSGPLPYIDGIILSATQNITTVPSKHRGTDKGASGYSLKKLLIHWLNMFTNFSVKPLRMIFFLGLLTGCFSVLGFIYVVIWRIFAENPPPGWSTTAVLLLFFGSVQLISLGLVGEYVGRVLLHINNRPQFIFRPDKPEDPPA